MLGPALGHSWRGGTVECNRGGLAGSHGFSNDKAGAGGSVRGRARVRGAAVPDRQTPVIVVAEARPAPKAPAEFLV